MREMKDSGIEWIGEIPKDWDILRLKYCFSGFANGTSNTQLNSGESFYPVTRIETISSGEINLDKIGYVAFSKKQYLLQTGDILVSNINSIKYLGNCAVVRDGYKLYHGMNLLRIVPSDYIDKGYAYYLFKSNVLKFPMEKYCKPAINQVSVSATTMKNFFIPFPAFVKQQQIADFLDTQCSEIDATAEDIQKEISLLEEYKKSLVYNVISNGINHSIYSTENDEVWGNLPQGWKLVDIKYLFEIVKRIAGKEGYDVLSVTQKGLKIKDITSGDGQLADNYCGYQFVYPTDYVMNHMDLLTGWVDCSELFGVTSPDYRVFRLIDRSAHNLVYYKYVMQCCYMNKIFYSLGQGVSNLGRWRLQTSSFNNFKVPVPPKAEQDEIADYLDSKCSEIDSLIADKKRQLDILADYKKSLIYEYVTGKKEVI